MSRTPYKSRFTAVLQHSPCKQPYKQVPKMSCLRVLVIAALLALGNSRDLFSVRTFGQQGQSNKVVHQNHNHAQALPGSHQHAHGHQISSGDVTGAVATEAVMVCQIVNVPVIQKVRNEPVTSVGSSLVPATPVGSSLVPAPVNVSENVTANLTPGLGQVVVNTFINPVVSLLQNATAWFNGSSQAAPLGEASSHQLNHGGHSTHGHGGPASLNQVHGLPAQLPPVHLIIIDQASLPAIGSGIPAALGMVPVRGGAAFVNQTVVTSLGASAVSGLERPTTASDLSVRAGLALNVTTLPDNVVAATDPATQSANVTAH